MAAKDPPFGDDGVVHDVLMQLAQLSAQTNIVVASILSNDKKQAVEILRTNTALLTQITSTLLAQQKVRVAEDEQ